MENNQNLISSDLQVDSIAYTHLNETARWSYFLGIVGFVVSGLYVIIAIFAGTFMSQSAGIGSMRNIIGTVGMTIFYLLFASLGFAVSLFMLRFAKKMKFALQNYDQESLNTAFKNLKLVYRFYGITMIVALAFMALVFIVAIGAALFAGR
ncbi:MAG: hypothetical protein H7X88_07690 [Gloeobacteraceae cyanobacterium ES-bin-316]|nr:hypothetical protein [Ferruginibacter sp.]